MSIRKRSPYGNFVERVLLPSVRLGAVMLAILAIGFGSWLETNDKNDDCAFKSSMSLHQVFLYRNISSNITTPDSVSFGLWKHCYFYALNCSCTPSNLRYQPDVSTILQTATENLAIPPITNKTSLSRIVPLALATVLCGIALFVGLWANRRGKYIYRKIICGLIIATMVLVAYSFGSSYDQYFKMIESTCKNPNNTVYCARHAVQIEVVLFSMALGLLFIALIFWFIASNLFNTMDEEEEEEDVVEEKLTTTWNFRKSATPKKSEKNQSNIEQNLTTRQGGDDTTIWRDVEMINEEYDGSWDMQDDFNNPQKKYYQLDNIDDPYNNPLPPPAKHYTNFNNSSNPHYRQQQKHIRGYQEQQRRSSSHLIGPNERVSLTPPKATMDYYNSGTRGNYKPRVTSTNQNNNSRRQQRKSSTQDHYRNNNVTNNNGRYRNSRKESNDSALTFGGGNNHNRHQQHRKSSGRPLSELEFAYKNTPTSISPHPFQYPSQQMNTNGYCMTPYYDDALGPGSSSSGGSHNSNPSHNSSGYFQQQNVPILSMPPNVVEHPLNKKKIKDKRIQSYLQTTTSS